MRDQWRKAVAAAFEDGEQVLAMAVVRGQDPGVVEKVSVKDEMLNLLDPTIWIGLGSHPGQGLKRLMLGRAVRGSQDSTAAWLHGRLEGTVNSSATIVLLRDRLVVGQMDLNVMLSDSANPPALPQGQASWFIPGDGRPRQEFVSARRAPKGLLRRSRVVVECADGSAVSVLPLGRYRQELIDAINGSAEPPGDSDA